MVKLISLPNNALYKSVVELNLQPRFETITNQRNKTSGVKFLLSPKKDVETEVFGPEGRIYDEIDAEYRALYKVRLVRIITQDDTSKRAKKDKPTFGCSIYYFQNNSATNERDANWYKGHITHQKKGDVLFWTHAHYNTSPLIRCEVSYENKRGEKKTKQFFLTPYHINDAFLQDPDLFDAHKEDLEKAQMDAHNRYVALIKAYPTNIANDPRYGKSATPLPPSTPASLQSSPVPTPNISTNNDTMTKEMRTILHFQLRKNLLERYFTNDETEFIEDGVTYTRKTHKEEHVLEQRVEELEEQFDDKGLKQYFEVLGHVQAIEEIEMNVEKVLNATGRQYFVAHMLERKKREEEERERKRREEIKRRERERPKRAVSEMLKSRSPNFNVQEEKKRLNILMKEREQKSKDITECENPKLLELHNERWNALDKEITSIKVRLEESYDDQSKRQKQHNGTDDEEDDDDDENNDNYNDDINEEDGEEEDDDSKNQDDADDGQDDADDGEVVEGQVIDEVADALGSTRQPIPQLPPDENISTLPDPKLCECGIRRKGEGLGKGNHSLCKVCKENRETN